VDSTEDTVVSRVHERRALMLLLGFCLLLGSAGAFVTIRMDAAPSAPLQLGNVSEAQLVEIHDANNRTVLTGEFRSRVDSMGNVEKDAALYGRDGRKVVGEIELEIPAAREPARRPELEADIVSLSPNASYTIVIDGRPVAAFLTDDRGSIDREIQEGEPFRDTALAQ
jgi:hypothetical protein